jgi:hypothetical protein
MSKAGRRVIARDACSWCGHQHDQACTATIRVKSKPETFAPCPCTRPLVVVT